MRIKTASCVRFSYDDSSQCNTEHESGPSTPYKHHRNNGLSLLIPKKRYQKAGLFSDTFKSPE